MGLTQAELQAVVIEVQTIYDMKLVQLKAIQTGDVLDTAAIVKLENELSDAQAVIVLDSTNSVSFMRGVGIIVENTYSLELYDVLSKVHLRAAAFN